MPRGFSQPVKDNLEKCRSAAIAAVETYNRPGPRFRTAQYLVMIVIAWTALLHAIFYKRGRRPWYRKRTSGTGTGVRYQRIDGEPRHWDLAKCLNEFYGDKSTPERQNLQFLLGLRNKIEHRHLPQLDASLYGECQAALMNLEGLLCQEFGARYALEEELAVSLQFSRTIPVDKRRTARVLASSTATTVTEYVEKFRGGLPASVLNSMKYSFNVFLVPRVVNREAAADAAVQFVPLDEASDEERQRLERLNVLIREKHIPISNLDLLKPTQVVAELRDRLPFRVTMATHTAAWKHYKVRPPTAAAHPARTQTQYAVYDSAHNDYLYTRAWVERLAQDLTNPTVYEQVTGRPPRSSD